MKTITKVKIHITHSEVSQKVSFPRHKRITRNRKDWMKNPSSEEVFEIWKGLPFKEKITMILKQFFPGM